ncbi:MAG: histone deacetylase [Candidatus Bathyarchaeota archaeon]|jgi:acetoin utilization deacetylase AcuC-like enzyme|nr:histone deacetylase [Candidatus Bathyarchaeota archaeon]
MKTAILFTPKYLEHDTGRDHPESPTRLRVIREELEKSMLLETGKCSIVKPEPARIKDVELVHDPEYVDLVKRFCKSGGGLLDLGDTVVSSKSFEVALLAVGGGIEAVKLVAKEEFQNAFALVRPPGHHAGRYYALGFCVFNNVAVAAEYLLRYFGTKRILILDIDAHHGNGTQEIFYNTNRVLYLSLHEDPRGFPGTGFIDEVGEQEGRGYTVNLPLPFRTSDKVYLKAFDQIVTPITQQYKPEFILVSAGFDGFYLDPVGALSLSAHIYTKVYSKILNLSSQFCNGKLVAILEGGYHLKTLGRLASSAIARLASIAYTVESKRSLHPSTRLERKAERVIDEVKRVQSSFWSFKNS